VAHRRENRVAIDPAPALGDMDEHGERMAGGDADRGLSGGGVRVATVAGDGAWHGARLLEWNVAQTVSRRECRS
jgi:hypothetical protein